MSAGTKAAFPFDTRVEGFTRIHAQDGMTLREYYIGQALAGAAANPRHETMEDAAKAAVALADQVLKHLEGWIS